MTERYIPEPGDRVRVRRWEVPSTEVTGDAQRKLSVEFTGTVITLDQYDVLYCDPASIEVTVDTIDAPGMPDIRHAQTGTGNVFLGQDREHGGSWTLITEVERIEDGT